MPAGNPTNNNKDSTGSTTNTKPNTTTTNTATIFFLHKTRPFNDSSLNNASSSTKIPSPLPSTSTTLFSHPPVHPMNHDVNNNSDEVFPRVLLGIFSVYGNPRERQRRQLIRETYLSYDYQTINHNHHRFRICTLQEWLDHNNNKSNNNSTLILDQCQLIYTFVMAAHSSHDLDKRNTTTDIPTELLYYPSHPSDMVSRDPPSSSDSKRRRIPHHHHHHHQVPEPKDGIYLKIRENMNQGKTLTWFHYASSLLLLPDNSSDNNKCQVTWIVKADTDTIILPHLLLELLTNLTPLSTTTTNTEATTTPNNVTTLSPASHSTNDHINTTGSRDLHFLAQSVKPKYPQVTTTTHQNNDHTNKFLAYGGRKDQNPYDKASFYARGGLYWLSVDLARIVTSPAMEATRQDVRQFLVSRKRGIRPEDVEMGLLIHHLEDHNVNNNNNNSYIQKDLLDHAMIKAWHHRPGFKHLKQFEQSWSQLLLASSSSSLLSNSTQLHHNNVPRGKTRHDAS